MKRDSLKRNMFLSLTLLTCTGFNLVADEVSGTPVAVSSLNETDTAYILQLTQDIKGFIESVKGDVESCLTDKAKKSIAHYIDLFEQKLTQLESGILKTHKDTLANCSLDQKSAYYQALKTTDEILMELHAQLKQFHKIVTDPKNLSKAVVLATKLAEQNDKLMKKYDLLDQKLETLHTHLHELELATLIQEVAQIRALVKLAKNAPPLTNARKAELVKIIDTMMKIKA